MYVDMHNFDVETFNWLLAGLYKQWLEFPKVQFFNNYVIDGGLVQQIHIFYFKLKFYTFFEWKFLDEVINPGEKSFVAFVNMDKGNLRETRKEREREREEFHDGSVGNLLIFK